MKNNKPVLIIDIETKAKKSLSHLHKSDDPQAVDTDLCEIKCIGIKMLGSKETRVLDSLKQMKEGGNWETWKNLFTQCELLTFNGKRFDIPVLLKQAVLQDIDLPFTRLKNACKPWGYGERHIDLMESLAFGGRYKSLDHYLEVFLGINKETKGEDFFKNATKKQIREHCKQDLFYTEQLYNTVKHIV